MLNNFSNNKDDMTIDAGKSEEESDIDDDKKWRSGPPPILPPSPSFLASLTFCLGWSATHATTDAGMLELLLTFQIM